MPKQPRDVRVALNESRFREINERMQADLSGVPHRPQTTLFVCECGRLECRRQIELTDTQYQAIRADPMTFALAPGHQVQETEDVVADHGSYLVVRKHETVRDIVEATDPRHDD